MLVSAQLVLCIIRLVQGFMKFDMLSMFRKKKVAPKVRESLLGSSNIDLSKEGIDEQFHWLEKNIIENVNSDFILVCSRSVCWNLSLFDWSQIVAWSSGKK